MSMNNNYSRFKKAAAAPVLNKDGSVAMPSKYKNKKTRTQDGHVVDSGSEGFFYDHLLSMGLKNGETFFTQKEFVIFDFELKKGKNSLSMDKGVQKIKYKLDFLIPTADGILVIDVKGMETADFKLKKKLILKLMYMYNLENENQVRFEVVKANQKEMKAFITKLDPAKIIRDFDVPVFLHKLSSNA